MSAIRLHRIGARTAKMKTLGGSCEGFFKSSNIVKFGTIIMVYRYTMMMPPARETPTVLIGAIGVRMSETKPITVVTAERNTALPVDCRASAIFSFGVPFDSAYRLVMCNP